MHDRSSILSRGRNGGLPDTGATGAFMVYGTVDGIPWNNNNAEHAVKKFVLLRDVIRGTCTEGGIREYLILLHNGLVDSSRPGAMQIRFDGRIRVPGCGHVIALARMTMAVNHHEPHSIPHVRVGAAGLWRRPPPGTRWTSRFPCRSWAGASLVRGQRISQSLSVRF